MEPQTLANGDKVIKYIYHISDIHIMNDVTRHTEYRHVFDNLYAEIQKNTNDSVIVITGDVVENKTTLKPKCIKLLKEFYMNLTNLCDVITIIGNHDCNNNNEDDMDALFPNIKINFVTKNQLHLLKDNGTYFYYNIAFGVTTIFSNEVTPPLKTKDYINVALYHGTLNGSSIGKVIITNNKIFSNKSFDGYDLVLLGDIHKFQYLNKSKTIAYASSLIEQNPAEIGSGHGMLIWNILDKTSNYVEIPNEYRHLVLNIDNNVLQPYDIESAPKHPKIRLYYKNSDFDKILAIENELRNVYNISDFRKIPAVEDNINIDYIKQSNNIDIDSDNDSVSSAPVSETSNNENVNTSFNTYSYISQLLNNFVDRKNFPIDKDMLLSVLIRIKSIIENLNTDENSYAIKTLKLINMSFDNLFSYGKNNEINFEKLSGIIGIAGKNGHGKSSIVDSILYAIFDEFSKGKKYDAININKESAKVTLAMSLNDDIYVIDRSINIDNKKKGTYTSKVAIMKNGDNVSESNKTETNKYIDKNICSYEDLTNTNIILQQSTNFLDLTDKQKRDYLYGILNLDIFNDIVKAAKNASGSNNHVLGKCNSKLADKDTRDNINAKIHKTIENINELTRNIEKYNNERDQLNIVLGNVNIVVNCEEELKLLTSKKNDLYYDRKKLSDDINYYQSKLIDTNELEVSIPDENIKIIVENKLKSLQFDNAEYIRVEREVNNLMCSLSDMEKKINTLSFNIKYIPVNVKKLQKKYDKYINLVKSLKKCESENNDLLLKKKKLIEQYKQYCDHEYNTNCEACMKNPITQNKILFEKQIEETNNLIDVSDKNLLCVKLEIQKNGNIESEYNQGLIIDKDNTQYIELYEKYYDYMNKYIKLSEEYIIISNQYFVLKKINAKRNKYQMEINTINEKINKMLDVKKNNCKYEELINKANKSLNELILSDQENDAKLDSLKVNNNDELIKKKQRLDELNIKIKDCTMNLTKSNEQLTRYNCDIEYINDIEKDIASIHADNVINKKIIELIDNKSGIVNDIMNSEILPKIQQRLNYILSFITSFQLELEYVNESIKVYKLDDNKKLNCKNLSGFERFLVNIAFRLIFNKINKKIRTDFLIIDEGFSCCDADNMTALKALFEYIRENYKYCLLISHIDSIKDNFDSIIMVTKNNGISKIKN